MDSERLKHLRDLLGYDNERLARSLHIEVAEVEDYCLGRAPVSGKIAENLELFVDWASEVGDTRVKKELAKKHLGGK